jgi:adenine phosphoribosyltransferase
MPEILVSSLKDKKIDKVIGVESRFFFFGMLIAQELNVGFVPVRKPNKLPYDTISASYELEYGTDTPEIHTDAIRKAIGYLFMMMSSLLEERPKRFVNWWRN